ncbi:unnamed protein product, partial [Closterium sp. Naga37s-1]
SWRHWQTGCAWGCEPGGRQPTCCSALEPFTSFMLSLSSFPSSRCRFLEALADRLCMGDVNQAAHRVLKDFRRGAFGWIALERPPV